MKKTALFICMITIFISLAACGRNDNNANNNNNNNNDNNASSSINANNESSSHITTSEPVVDNETETTVGTEQETAWSKEMETIKAAVVKALGDNYWPNFKITSKELEEQYGITPDLYDDYMGEVPMINTNVDTMIIVKAKEDKVDEVDDALETYRDKLVNSTMQYPMNIGKIQSSRIEIIGDYVCFIQLGADTSAVQDEGEDGVIRYCQEQNEMVIEILHQTIDR